MAAYIGGIKQIMERIQSYTITIPQSIKADAEVNRLLTKLDIQIELLKMVNLHNISYNQTDELSQAARKLQAEL